MGIFELPEGYAEIKRVNLKKDKKLAVLLNIAVLIIAAALVPIGLAVTPIYFSSIIESGYDFSIHMFILIFGIIVYMVGHELVHGIFIKKYSGKKAKYGLGYMPMPEATPTSINAIT